MLIARERIMSRFISTCVRQQLSISCSTKPTFAFFISKRLHNLTEKRNANLNFTFHRLFCDKKKESSLTESKSTEVGAPTTFQQVKETTKTASYLSVILVGVGVTAVIFYQVFRELFSSKSPNSVYSASLKKCIQDTRIVDSLGEPIKGFGEETRRGRRRHVSHVFYEKEGINYLRMKYYIQGSRRRATVHLEMWENEKGDFDYRYLFVQLDDHPRNIIVIEDNRHDKHINFEKGLFET